jgi:hypothetical protein
MHTENSATQDEPSINELVTCVKLQICPRTLVNWRKKGIAPPHFKNGKETRYLLKDVENFEIPQQRRRGKAKPKIANHEALI